MGNLQKAGGVAAWIGALTVVVGLGLYATLLSDYTTGDPTPSEKVAFLADNQSTMFVWNLIVLVVFGVALVVVSMALYERLMGGASAIARTASAFGLMWAGLLIASGMVLNVGMGNVVDLHATDPAQAGSIWMTIESVGNALGGQMEIVGAMWILLISWAGIRTGQLPRAMNYLGFLMGASAIVTVVPALELVAIGFGLGLIVWFGWLGFVMYRDEVSMEEAEQPSIGVPREVSEGHLTPH